MDGNMPVIEWDERFATQIPQIDKHHQHLFFLLNKTYDAFSGQNRSQNLTSLFDNFIDYVTYHFSEEEKWMLEVCYPGLEKQKTEHAEFFRKVMEAIKYINNRKKSVSLEILSFVHDWLSDHILSSDAEFGRFFTLQLQKTKNEVRPNNL